MLFNNTNMRTAMAYTNAVGDKVYPIIVDIKKGIKSTEEVSFVSSDINTGVLSVAFIQGNDTYNVAGAEVICSIMRPDASTLDIPCTVMENNIVEVPLGVNGTSQDGVYSFDFKVFKGGNKVVGTPTMNYSVSLSISNDNAVLEDDRLPVLTMLMTQVSELHDRTDEAVVKANTATEATKVATANAIEATNNVNAVINTANQKMVEVDNAKNEMTTTVTNKVNEVEGRFNALTASQQQSSEVIDARDGETSLKARLDRDIEKAKEIYVNVEGSHISTDSSSGYLKDVEILGNTIQDASNLADIRSVGDKVEGQELYEIPVLSVGKNLAKDISFAKTNNSDKDWIVIDNGDGSYKVSGNGNAGNGFALKLNVEVTPNTTYTFSFKVDGVYPTSKKDMYVYKGFNTLWDNNKLFHSGKTYTFTTPSDTNKICLGFYYGNTTDTTSVIISDIQLEEGTVATPYEPYQEDKLTILSPVQLEKVGDVADRIICKDGVWGVEKNVETVVFDGDETNIQHSYTFDGFYRFRTNSNDYVGKSYMTLSNTFEAITSTEATNGTKEGVMLAVDSNNIQFLISKTKVSSTSVQEFKQWLSENPTTVKYQLATPQFIPLPHSQQIKLRTFASKTNISFLTEIEGTIKAQVPKSLGATVNTHTEQISNLNKELDRVKKLEESTVSTVETESDFTTVEATSNGYFEDVKLEGKTLVNLVEAESSYTITKEAHSGYIPLLRNFEVGKHYTIIFNVSSLNLDGGTYAVLEVRGRDNDNSTYTTPFENYRVSSNGVVVISGILAYSLKNIYIKVKPSSHPSNSPTFNVDKLIILEGDHTQNPPSYFEGLMSVGQDVDKIEVLSSNANSFCTPSYYRVPAFSEAERNVPNSNIILIKNGSTTQNILFTDNSIERLDTTGNYFGQSHKIKVKNLKPNTEYQISYNIDFKQSNHVWCGFLDAGENVIPISSNHTRITRTRTSNHLGEIEGFMFVSDDWIKYSNIEIKLKESSVDDYTPHQSDKKQILFYNTETQTWEKPILRQWDSIEKHADGKYYYHQRSGEVVLNGSEGEKWVKNENISNGNYAFMHLQGQQIKPSNSMLDFICDKLVVEDYNVASGECISKYTNGTELVIKVTASKLSTQDVQGFKQWLQSNNVTVVYQLAEEKVYEVANIDLITFANETNYIVECGAIVPRTTLKVHNNISNVVKILQEKVSLLENKFIEGLKKVLAGDMYSLAELLYPEDFVEENPENNIMLLPFE